MSFSHAVPHGKLASNILIVQRSGISAGDDIQNLDGFYGTNNNIITLQRRGTVFIACRVKTMTAYARPLR